MNDPPSRVPLVRRIKILTDGWDSPDRWKPEFSKAPGEFIETIIQQIEKDFGLKEPKPPDLEELEKVKLLLKERWENGTLEDLPPRAWKLSPWVVFQDDFEPSTQPGFVNTYLAHIKTRLRPRVVNALLHAWALHYPDRLVDIFEKWRLGVLGLVQQGLTTGRHRFQVISQRLDLSQMLNTNGSRELARRLLETHDIGKTLEEAGLAGQLANGRFMLAVAEALLAFLENGIVEGIIGPEHLERILNNMYPIEPEYRFPSLEPSLATTLLEACGRIPSPEDAFELLLKRRFLESLGDPRLRPYRWNSVSETAKQVMLRWLTGDTLDLFMEVLDKTAVDRQWRYRKKFWRAYYDKGYLTEAWVAFGPDALAVAKRSPDFPSHGFGRLWSPDRKHSVLLMRIGKLTIAEWSHNGQCWLWTPGDRRAPRFYQREYDKKDVKGPSHHKYWVRSEEDARDPTKRNLTPLGFWHLSSERFLWQRRVHAAIRHHTGISLPFGTLTRPRRW